MTYDEAMQSRARVTRLEAQREIAAHGQRWEDFLKEYDDAESYRAATILAWLGY